MLTSPLRKIVPVVIVPVVIVLVVAGCSGSTPRGDASASGGETAQLAVDALPDIDGNSHTLLASDAPTVLVFWATWCAPCKRELPELGRASATHSGDAHWYGVLAGSDDQVNLGQVRSLTGRANVRYPQLRDRDGALVKSLGVKGTPTIVVIDAGGKILYRGHAPPESWESVLGS